MAPLDDDHQSKEPSASDNEVGENEQKPGKAANILFDQKDETSCTQPEPDTYFPDPNLHDPGTLEVVSWWAEFTSIHGVYYAFERGHFKLWKQTFWCVLTVACAGALIATLESMISEFKQFSLTTSTEKIIPNSLAFPMVTVCNTNMFDASLQNATGIQDPADEEELNRISQPLEDFIRMTSFNRIQYATVSEVWDPIITSFGRCYRFQTDKEVFKPGSNAGLEFIAWLSQDNYQESTAAAGLIVYVTQPNTELITDQTASVLVPPGQLSFLAVERLDTTREREKPWSKCTGTAPAYTNELCRSECIFEAVRKDCGCRQIGDPATNLPYCNSSDPCQIVNDTHLALCDCETPPCAEQVYMTYYSTARLSQKSIKQFAQKGNLAEDDFDDNFVYVVVNYRSIQYERFSESKDKSYGQLISDLGGQMGFFMGISLISIVEILELLGLRLLPRLWGDKRLYGTGQKLD